MSRHRWAAPVVVALALVACATAIPYQGDQYFDTGRFPQAVEAYRDYLASSASGGAAEARALYRLGFLHSLEGAGQHDSRKAQRYFALLEDRYPTSAYALQARLFVGLSRDAERLSARLAKAESERDGLAAELERQRRATTRSGSSGVSEARQIDLLETALDQLREEVARLREALAERELELERLKQIDLGTPPG